MKGNKYTQIIPKCFNCDSEMILDHIDYNFDGNQYNHFVCKKCNSKIIQNVRDGKIIRNLLIYRGDNNKGNKYTQEIPKCFNCDSKMILDHIDYNFNGNQDNYFICKKCNSEIIQNVRDGKIIRNLYIDEEGKIINIEKVR